MLFTMCRECRSSSVSIKKYITGSFLRIQQYCAHCKHTWCWESQPYIGTLPAGNILTSAAILYSGSLPAKALRMFHVLKCATVSAHTFYRHQREILLPSVDRVWERHQLSVLQSIADQKTNLFLSGDGRADSPGHSAKYGSYTVIDMFSQKVVDFKLVQVKMCSKCYRNMQHVLVYYRATKWGRVITWRRRV